MSILAAPRKPSSSYKDPNCYRDDLSITNKSH